MTVEAALEEVVVDEDDIVVDVDCEEGELLRLEVLEAGELLLLKEMLELAGGASVVEE